MGIKVRVKEKKDGSNEIGIRNRWASFPHSIKRMYIDRCTTNLV